MNELDKDAPDDWLPIRDVARQTGVNAVTLRAWERRYGLIVPHRTE
ncbi:MerR family DNA-binding transcriptional regulator, partial [Pseudomonas viridiflava]